MASTVLPAASGLFPTCSAAAIAAPDEMPPGIPSLRASAREVSIPSQNMFLHTLLQHYYVDGQSEVLNPIGLLGSKLEADFHIIHGIGTRIKNSVRCVKELDIEVLDVVFMPIAAAQVVLDENQKGLGALVIDMGGGTTDYIAYVRSVASGP